MLASIIASRQRVKIGGLAMIACAKSSLAEIDNSVYLPKTLVMHGGDDKAFKWETTKEAYGSMLERDEVKVLVL